MYHIFQLTVQADTLKAAVVLTTVHDPEEAKKLADALLDARLIACATVVPQVSSHYIWKGERETSSESLIILKTQSELVSQLEKQLRELHPYDTPEFISLDPEHVEQNYLKWLLSNTGKA